MDTLKAPEKRVNDILDRYQNESLPQLGERTRKDYVRHIQVLRQSFGERVAHEITRADLAAFMDVRSGKIQRNRILAVLSTTFSQAIDWGWLESNVCIGAPRHESLSRPRFVTAEEFDGFRRISPPNLWHVMELARHSGQLQGSILGLKWSQVHSTHVSFYDPKRRVRVDVPITLKLRAVLAECKKFSGGTHVVTNRRGKRYTSEGFRAVWQRYMDRWAASGNERFTFHDIRRTWAVLEKTSSRKITFTPTVFEVPETAPERDLVAVMMPFRSDFDSVYEAMRRASSDCGLRCLRASDIWEETAIIQVY